MQVLKRNKQLASFDLAKIEVAVSKALKAVGGKEEEAKNVAAKVEKRVKDKMDIEAIQDIVEDELMSVDHKAAKAYILYRQDHKTKREEKKEDKLDIKDSLAYFDNDAYRYFIFLRTYAKWLDDKGRRETWVECVDRYMAYMVKRLGDNQLPKQDYEDIRNAILKMEVMPSMRLLQFAGTCVDRDDMYAYNCSYGTPQNFKDMRDAMYILMCGTGFGFSVEKTFVDLFPPIKEQIKPFGDEVKEDEEYKSRKLKAWRSHFGLNREGICPLSKEKIDLLNFTFVEKDGKDIPCCLLSAPYINVPTYVIDDTKEAWCDALYFGLRTWAMGRDVKFDFSRIRKAGLRLKGTGGRASGPQPLIDLLDFCRTRILQRQGSKLQSLDVHDILCKIGQIVVAGNVRRSALISLSDLDDEAMRKCKSGPFWNDNSQRFLANNSAVYAKKPTDEEFMEEWLSLIKSRSGERGIFNRQSLNNLPSRRLDTLGDNLKHMGTNPCGEIILRPCGLCNLTTIVCRPNDTEQSLLRKIRLAAILGTYQSTLTNINYVNPLYKKNAEEERLLGVSMTGQFDCKAVRNKETLVKLKETAVAVNAQYAKMLNIPVSMAVTAVKPEGTVSEMVGSASGMHARFSKHYIRRVRINSADPLCKMMKDQGVPWDAADNTTAVFQFPVAAPKDAITRDDVKALDMLEYWRLLKQYYCEHNPSVSIDVGPDEWIDCQQWIMKNWSIVGGISFFPRSDHIYTLAPFEKISEEQYNKMPKTTVDYGKIIFYEKEDETDRKAELACAGKDGCSL